jgi:nucleoside-diphosphate-sugar epimerase
MSASPLPERFATVAELDDCLSEPTPELAADLAKVSGDILVLGVAGKMGPTLARMAKRAAPDKRVVGVARFSDQAVRIGLEAVGIETIACDLLHRRAVEALPKLPNVVYMAAMKFGASGNPALTWAMNVHAPTIVAEACAASRIVAFSTGCVYPFVPVDGGGATEDTPAVPPPGDYAYSCLGRERMFEHFSARLGTAGRLIRLNYAIDMRYGVLHDIGAKVLHGEPIDLSMGHVNVIWQGDANVVALRCLAHTTTPTSPLNVTGPQTLRVRWLAEEFARRFRRTAQFTGSEGSTGWLNDASRMVAQFGSPRVSVDRMLDWTADWLSRGMASHGKPTRYEVRDGRY